MKALLYSFAACLYAMQISFICWAIFLFNDYQLSFVFIIVAALSGIAAFILGGVGLAFGISQISNPKDGTFKTVMIVKLILTPFFVINFIIGFLVMAAFANPFLILAGFIVIPLMIILTYAAMLVTSSYNLGAMVHKIRNKESTFGDYALFIASQFIYFFDVVGSIIIYIRLRNEEKGKTI